MINYFFLNFIEIDLYSVNQRIDNFLFKKIKCLPKNKIYSLLRKGNIRVNNKRVRPKYKLNLKDIIRIPLINLKEQNKNFYFNKNKIIKFKKYIIYEDKYLLVINKPSGISVHRGKKIYWNIIDIYRNIFSNIKYLELVHRIDKYTSGILLMSKNIFLLRNLHFSFKNRNIKKKYLALVYGLWPENINKINNFDLLKKFSKFNFYFKNKFCETFFKVKEYIGNFTLLIIYPKTGCKHQIRLHTSYLGFPIVGDYLYGNKDINKFFFKFNFKRLFLHSYYISFFYPILKKKIFFYAKLSKELLYILNFLRKYKN